MDLLRKLSAWKVLTPANSHPVVIMHFLCIAKDPLVSLRGYYFVAPTPSTNQSLEHRFGLHWHYYLALTTDLSALFLQAPYSFLLQPLDPLDCFALPTHWSHLNLPIYLNRGHLKVVQLILHLDSIFSAVLHGYQCQTSRWSGSN